MGLTNGLISSNGANLSWPQAFGVPDKAPEINPGPAAFYDRNSWIVGVVNAGGRMAFKTLDAGANK